jgi:hypothetical protein
MAATPPQRSRKPTGGELRLLAPAIVPLEPEAERKLLEALARALVRARTAGSPAHSELGVCDRSDEAEEGR